MPPDRWTLVQQSATTELAVHGDLLVQVGRGAKVHVFRGHPRLAPVVERLLSGTPVRAVALCGTKGEMVATGAAELAPDDDSCGTCSRMLRDEDDRDEDDRDVTDGSQP